MNIHQLQENRKELKINISALEKTQVEEAVQVAAQCWPEGGKIEEMARREMHASLEERVQLVKIEFITAALATTGKIIGFSAWSESPMAENIYELCWAGVLPAYRQRGVNTAMLDARLNRIKQYNTYSNACVMVRTWECPLYRNRGFTAAFKDEMQHPAGKSLLLARLL